MFKRYRHANARGTAPDDYNVVDVLTICPVHEEIDLGGLSVHQVARPQGLEDRPTVVGGLHACSGLSQPPTQNQGKSSTSRAQAMLAEQHLLATASIESHNVRGRLEEQPEVEVVFDGQQPGRFRPGWPDIRGANLRSARPVSVRGHPLLSE